MKVGMRLGGDGEDGGSNGGGGEEVGGVTVVMELVVEVVT